MPGSSRHPSVTLHGQRCVGLGAKSEAFPQTIPRQAVLQRYYRPAQSVYRGIRIDFFQPDHPAPETTQPQRPLR
jgi:hypothetical protein